MKNGIKYVICLVFLLSVADASAWVKTGHEVISILATEQLTPKTKRAVEKILGGDIRSNSVWLNELKKPEASAHTRFWHNTKIGKDGRSSTRSDKDGIVQLERNIEILRHRNEHSDSLVVAALRTVIHLVGDLHCVAHIRFEDIPYSDNFIFYRSNGKSMKKEMCSKMTWYKLWSKWYFDIHAAFSPEMFAEEIRMCQSDKFGEYMHGTPRTWVEEMGRESRPLIEYIKPEEVLDNATSYNWELVHERCLAKASVRLAGVLNDIFK